MKTTIEINDELLRQARLRGIREGVTLRSLVERGLSLVLGRNEPVRARKIELRVFSGATGFTPEFEGADWASLKEESRRR